MVKKIRYRVVIFAVSVLSILGVSCSSEDLKDDKKPIIGNLEGKVIAPPVNFPNVFPKKPTSGKEIYIPNYLKDNDFDANTSEWSYQRSDSSSNITVFWQSGFGQYPNKAIKVNLQVDIKKLLDMAEEFFEDYKNTIIMFGMTTIVII